MEKWAGTIERFAGCFRDHRAAGQVEHRVRDLVEQRVYGLALGYEDPNDHEQLRRDRGKALADKSTLNRLELTTAVYRLLVEIFLEAHRRPTAKIVPDPDATDDPLHGSQIRIYFSSMAYVLMKALRRLGLKQTELARAQTSTIRLKLLKIGALVRITVRRVWVLMAGGHPYAELFGQACARLRAFSAPC